jgi:hypothetical protein
MVEVFKGGCCERAGRTAKMLVTSKIAVKMQISGFKFFILSLLISYSPLSTTF